MKTSLHVYHISLNSSVNEKHFRQNFQRKSKHTFCVQYFFFFRKSCLCEMMWKNIVEPGRPHLKIWSIRIACWIPTSTQTHSEYLMLNAFPLQQWLHERASVLHYMYIACLVNIQTTSVKMSHVTFPTAIRLGTDFLHTSYSIYFTTLFCHLAKHFCGIFNQLRAVVHLSKSDKFFPRSTRVRQLCFEVRYLRTLSRVEFIQPRLTRII